MIVGRGWLAAGVGAWVLCCAELIAAQTSAPVLVGAGDIADCKTDRAEATAKLLGAIGGTVFTAGDNAYGSGSEQEFARCYHPAWGRHKARTRPAPGNHDYDSDQAAPYFKYFGANAGPAGRGYYRYELGGWQIYSLNSNVNAPAWGAAQEQRLAKELAANRADCVLAYWHHPLFSSSAKHGNQPHMVRINKLLHVHGADVVVAGHDHTYERFAPQDSEGRAAADGIRHFVVGTGGAPLYEFGPARRNSEMRSSTAHGVLKLTLHRQSYDWEFVPVAGAKFSDRGSGRCGLPSGAPKS